MNISGMRVCHQAHPLGISPRAVTLAYRVEGSRGHRQAAARILLSRSPSQEQVCMDTGWVNCAYDENTGCLIAGIDALCYPVPAALAPRTRYWWQVRVRTDAQEEAVSEWSWFETAKGEKEPWLSRFIGSPLSRDIRPLFAKTFTISRPVASARMYCLGLGVYEAKLNGTRLGDEVLLPGLHTYDKALQYQTFELPVQQGENTVSFLLGQGWYMGRYGLKASAPRYGTDYALIAELHISYVDGTEDILGTDEGWQVRPSYVTFDGIYDGEAQDANLLRCPEESCSAVEVSGLDTDLLMPRLSPHLRVQEERTAVLAGTKGTILDFGQNVAGWVSFRCNASKGTVVRLRFGELLREGRVYRDNLRSAKSEFTYVSDGEERLVCPHFTYFGFRYVEVEGIPAPLCPRDYTACVIYSDMERTGWIETSDENLNRLFENQLWSQKDNFLDVPTDCPQRDERMGWTGDIQIFSDTACFNMDCTAFLRKFLHDLANDQASFGGCVPCVTPMAGYRLPGVAAWGDAATIVPWNVYLHSGDASILREQLPSMKGWVNYIRRETEADGTGFLWTKTAQLGDWLALDGNSVYGGTDRGLIATAYYFLSAALTAKAAGIVGESADAAGYGQLAENIKQAFLNEYVTPSGRLVVDTQTAYALCRTLGLLPENGRKRAANALYRKVIEAGSQLETGFVGTPCLMEALRDGGHPALAYTLLLRQEYPGWLYEVGKGATTIWERWNSIEPDDTMNRDGMNSLNHYAYGAVAGWMYRTMGGIAPVEEAPGFRCIRIAPIPDRRIRSCCTKLMTGLGLCQTQWSWQEDLLKLEITVPFDTLALVTLPGQNDVQRLGAGIYTFDLLLQEDSPAGLDAPWREVLAGEQTRMVVEELFPRAIRGVAFQNEMYTLEQLTRSPFAELDRTQVRALDEALRQAQQMEGLRRTECREEDEGCRS